MKNHKLKIISLALFMLLQLPFLKAQIKSEQWNQFRGAQRNGTVENIEIQSFSEKTPKLLWKKNIGNAFSEITICSDKIYTMTSEKKDSITGSEFVAAYNAETGKKIWKTKIDSIFFNDFGDGPRSTPTVDNDMIYSLSSYGKLTASSKKDGKTLWQIDFIDKYKSKSPRWGYSTSPIIINNNVIVEVGGNKSRAFMAFDKTTGEEIWNNGNGAASYNSPLLTEINGQKNIIFANGKTIYSLNTHGDTIWTFNSPLRNPTGMPVKIGDNKIFLSAVQSPSFIVIEIDKNNKSKLVTKGSSMKNDFSSSVYYNGHIYGFHVAALQCISVTNGEKKWVKRGYGKGSLIRIGKQLMVLSDKGKLIQVKASPEAYVELGSIQALNGKSWTAPSYANGKIYLRNLTEMACYQLK
nr:PQQ-binding-like beta-propeller repeat protein [uncultured Marinifilum sp.]